MAQPAKGPAHAPCSTPPVHTEDTVSSVHPVTAPTFHAGLPAWAQTVLGSGTSARALVAVPLNQFFHHLGTRSRHPAPALKSS
jgi:xanthine/uracil permease